MERIPLWARKLGLAGLIVLVLLWLGRLVIDAILEQEIQDIWTDPVKPFLLSSLTIEIPWWVLFSLMIVATAMVSGYVIVRKAPRSVNGMLNLHRLKSPKALDTSDHEDNRDFDKIDVLKARRLVEEGKLAIAEYATIVEQAINTGNLKAETGAELLEEVDYRLILRSDGSYTVRKTWRET